jgi:Fe-S-cluster formation regulator IscX/YfhJ
MPLPPPEPEPEIDPTLTITVSLRDLALVLDNFGFDDPTADSYEAFQRLLTYAAQETPNG